MKIIIEIPEEFECDYKTDKFKDFFSRVQCDIENGTLCGNYEKETAEMFLKAFDESVPMDNIVEKLEEASFLMPPREKGHYADNGLFLEDALNIVKQEN